MGRREERRDGGISRRGEGLEAKRKVSVDQTLILSPLCSAAKLPHCVLLCVCPCVCVCVCSSLDTLESLRFGLKWKRSTVAARTHGHTETQGPSQSTPSPDLPLHCLCVLEEGPPH